MSKKKDTKKDHTYRKHDVTGALSFVRSQLEWDLMPEEDRPKTDREAAQLFFTIDRSNATMAEFLAALKDHCVEELERLTKENRKPPKKKLAGFVNMATGEKRAAFPDFLTLPSNHYDELLALVRWIEQMPECVEFPDGAWDQVNDKIVDFVPLDEAQWPGVFVDSVQIETIKTTQRNIVPGTLVVLLQHENCDGDTDEHHCVLVRGNYKP